MTRPDYRPGSDYVADNYTPEPATCNGHGCIIIGQLHHDKIHGPHHYCAPCDGCERCEGEVVDT